MVGGGIGPGGVAGIEEGFAVDGDIGGETLFPGGQTRPMQGHMPGEIIVQFAAGDIAQPQLGAAQGLGRRQGSDALGGNALQMVFVEFDHEQSGGEIVDRPQGAHHAGHARLQETCGQAHGLVRDIVEVADGGLASRKAYQTQAGEDLAAHHLPQGEGLLVRQLQVGVQRVGRVEEAVAGAMGVGGGGQAVEQGLLAGVVFVEGMGVLAEQGGDLL